MHPQQRTRRVPSHREESLAVVGVVLLTVLEAVAYLCAPRSEHAFIGGALLGAGSAAAMTVAGTFTARRRRALTRRASAEFGVLDVRNRATSELPLSRAREPRSR